MSAYHLQENGRVKQFNCTVKAMLSKMVNENQHDWDSQLRKALFAYRTAVHEVTKFSARNKFFSLSGKFPDICRIVKKSVNLYGIDITETMQITLYEAQSACKNMGACSPREVFKI